MQKEIDYHFMGEITALRNRSHPGFIYSHLQFFPPFFIRIHIGRGTKVASTRIGYGYISHNLAILRQTHAERSCKCCNNDLRTMTHAVPLSRSYRYTYVIILNERDFDWPQGRRNNLLIPVSVLCEKSAWLIPCQFYVRNPSPPWNLQVFNP